MELAAVCTIDATGIGGNRVFSARSLVIVGADIWPELFWVFAGGIGFGVAEWDFFCSDATF